MQISTITLLLSKKSKGVKLNIQHINVRYYDIAFLHKTCLINIFDAFVSVNIQVL